MTADRLHYQYIKHIKAPTERKIVNCARKYGLRDTLAEVIWHTGLSSEKAKEFVVIDK